MANKKKISEGAMVALVTPFKGGKIDKVALKKLIEFQIDNGTDVIIPCGTTGESATMSHDEHRFVMEFVVDQVGGRVPVVCGAGSNNTEEALGLVQHAKKIKADGVLVVTPYYNKPTQEGLFRHYSFLAAKSHMPIILYNVPSRTGVSLAPDTVARLSKLDEVVAVKEASGDLGMVDKIQNLCNLPILSGDDALTLPMIAIGGRGVISVASNVVPGLMKSMVHSALQGDFRKAYTIHRKIQSLASFLFMQTNPIPVKAMLALMKKISPEVRLPLCEMSAQDLATLKKAIKKLGLIK
jgi:4-hydroxy-tetrahydrodipicolinate synthase